jgi:predicted amidohydrolase
MAAPVARRCLAGLVQMRSVNDANANHAACATLVQDAVRRGCKIVFFPECFSFIGAKAGEAQAAAEPLDGPTMGRYRDLARSHAVWLSLGGFQERCDGDERIYNTHVVLDASGRIRARYRKIHLVRPAPIDPGISFCLHSAAPTLSHMLPCDVWPSQLRSLVCAV